MVTEKNMSYLLVSKSAIIENEVALALHCTSLFQRENGGNFQQALNEAVQSRFYLSHIVISAVTLLLKIIDATTRRKEECMLTLGRRGDQVFLILCLRTALVSRATRRDYILTDRPILFMVDLNIN